MKPELFIVMQEGGTSSEQYLHSFNSKVEARRYLKECAESYSCSGPFELPVPEIGTLAHAANEALRWFREHNRSGNLPAIKLEEALSDLAPALRRQLRINPAAR